MDCAMRVSWDQLESVDDCRGFGDRSRPCPQVSEMESIAGVQRKFVRVCKESLAVVSMGPVQ